mmetsp:Transcript_53994/g.125551  ORF Transcript_53994/g.125551 Transcript_53994/m.125551 type:complete len:212 (-) Transcript_53994:275-910(-)
MARVLTVHGLAGTTTWYTLPAPAQQDNSNQRADLREQSADWRDCLVPVCCDARHELPLRSACSSSLGCAPVDARATSGADNVARAGCRGRRGCGCWAAVAGSTCGLPTDSGPAWTQTRGGTSGRQGVGGGWRSCHRGCSGSQWLVGEFGPPRRQPSEGRDGGCWSCSLWRRGPRCGSGRWHLRGRSLRRWACNPVCATNGARGRRQRVHAQ